MFQRLDSYKRLRDAVLSATSDKVSRYFRMPYVRAAFLHHLNSSGKEAESLSYKDGFVCLFFRGDELQKQIEVVPGQFAILLSRDYHANSMIKAGLPQLGLEKPHLAYEICEEEFTSMWNSLKLFSK